MSALFLYEDDTPSTEAHSVVWAGVTVASGRCRCEPHLQGSRLYMKADYNTIPQDC